MSEFLGFWNLNNIGKIDITQGKDVKDYRQQTESKDFENSCFFEENMQKIKISRSNELDRPSTVADPMEKDITMKQLDSYLHPLSMTQAFFVSVFVEKNPLDRWTEIGEIRFSDPIFSVDGKNLQVKFFKNMLCSIFSCKILCRTELN